MNLITQDAKQLLLDLALYCVPINPLEVCRKLGIIYNEQPYENFDGVLIVVGDLKLIGVNSNIKEPGRKAFTCAHEIGHAFYDLEEGRSDVNFQCTRNDVGYSQGKLDQREIRANEFASELLLPKDFFLAEIQDRDPSWKFLKEISKKYQTSLQATTNRFVKLTHHICWLIMVKNGFIHRFTKANHNDFSPALGKSFKSPKNETLIFKETMAESWFNESKKIRNKKLLFCSLPENQYGETPILLWDSKNTLHSNLYEEDDLSAGFSHLGKDVYRKW